MKEHRKQRSGRCEDERKQESKANVDPKQSARESMADFVALDDCLRQAVEPEVDQQQAKCGDHCHQAKIARSQEARKHNRAHDLNG